MTPRSVQRAAAGALCLGYLLLCGLSLVSLADELCAKRGGKLIDAGFGCLMGDGRITAVFSHLSWPRILLVVVSYGVLAYVLWAKIRKRLDAGGAEARRRP